MKFSLLTYLDAPHSGGSFQTMRQYIQSLSLGRLSLNEAACQKHRGTQHPGGTVFPSLECDRQRCCRSPVTVDRGAAGGAGLMLPWARENLCQVDRTHSIQGSVKGESACCGFTSPHGRETQNHMFQYKYFLIMQNKHAVSQRPLSLKSG